MFRNLNFLRRNSSCNARMLLMTHEEMLGKECLKHLTKIAKKVVALDDGWEKSIQEEMAFILDVSAGREALRNTLINFKQEYKETEQTKILKFNTSTLFLIDCWKYLVSDSSMNEKLHLVTGTVTEDGTRILSRMERVKLEKQSPAYVKADDKDAHLKIISLSEKHGHQLLAMFHSHMSRGAKATHPSGTDIANQKRFEKLGCDAIGGIFSLDGYVRFFSTWKDFEIEVYGKTTNRVSDEPRMKVFKLTIEETAG